MIKVNIQHDNKQISIKYLFLEVFNYLMKENKYFSNYVRDPNELEELFEFSIKKYYWRIREMLKPNFLNS